MFQIECTDFHNKVYQIFHNLSHGLEQRCVIENLFSSLKNSNVYLTSAHLFGRNYQNVVSYRVLLADIAREN